MKDKALTYCIHETVISAPAGKYHEAKVRIQEDRLYGINALIARCEDGGEDLGLNPTQAASLKDALTALKEQGHKRVYMSDTFGPSALLATMGESVYINSLGGSILDISTCIRMLSRVGRKWFRENHITGNVNEKAHAMCASRANLQEALRLGAVRVKPIEGWEYFCVEVL